MSQARRRPVTDLYVASVERAVGQPGSWVDVPKVFRSRYNASKDG